MHPALRFKECLVIWEECLRCVNTCFKSTEFWMFSVMKAMQYTCLMETCCTRALRLLCVKVTGCLLAPNASDTRWRSGWVGQRKESSYSCWNSNASSAVFVCVFVAYHCYDRTVTVHRFRVKKHFKMQFQSHVQFHCWLWCLQNGVEGKNRVRGEVAK